MNFEYYFDKIFNIYNVSSIKELSEVINTGASTISNWKQRGSITALKKRCRELGIYNEIFGDLKLSLSENSKEEDKTNSVLSNYFIALQSVAIAANKEDELIEDIKILMKKYIGE